MDITQLIAERRNLWAALSSKVEGRSSLSEGEAAELDAQLAKLATLDANIAQRSSLLDAEKRADEAAARWGSGLRGTQNADADDDSAAMRSLFVDAAKTGSAQADLARRVMTIGDASKPGPTAVRSGFVNQLIQDVANTSVIVSAGIDVLTTASGEPLAIPRVTGHTSAQIVGEGQPIPESDMGLGTVTIGAYKYAAFSQYSRELAEDAYLNFQDLVATDHVAQIVAAYSDHLVKGTGTGQPQGLFTGAASGIEVANVNELTFANFIALQFSVGTAYQANGKFVASPTAAVSLYSLTDNNGTPLYRPSIAAESFSTINGKPLVVEENAQGVGFGDLKQAYLLRQVGSVRVEASRDFAFRSDLVAVKTTFRADGRTKNANAFKKATTA